MQVVKLDSNAFNTCVYKGGYIQNFILLIRDGKEDFCC